MPTVLIAEDDPLLRALLPRLLEGEEAITVVGSVSNGREALTSTAELRPDVLLLDLHLPEVSGLRVLERLTEAGVFSTALVLSGDEADETAFAAARAGAKGFLGKSGALSRLGEAIRAVADGEVWFSRRIVSQILSDYPTLVRRSGSEDHPASRLTERERHILKCIARGMTNQQAARELLISVSTVKIHLQAIYQKLNVPNRTEAAVWAVRQGLVQEEDGSS
jgi:DNA-binding NarL/FixJ family response regulator